MKEVLMCEVFFGAVGAVSGFVIGGAQLAVVGLFLGSLMGLAAGLMQR